MGRKGKPSKRKRNTSSAAAKGGSSAPLSAAPPSPGSGASEDPKGRRRILMLLGAFLLFQLVVPLTYYLRDNPHDERFAWRMFSAIRLQRCQATAWENRDPSETGETGEYGRHALNLSQVTHQAWINTLQRNRREVIEAFLDRRCEEPGVEEVTLRNDCASPDGERSAFEYIEHCETGDIAWPGASEGPGSRR